MIIEPAPVHLITFDAVVKQVGRSADGLAHLRLYQEHEVLDAWSCTDVGGIDGTVIKATVTALPLIAEEGDTHVVTRLAVAPELEVFSLIPESFGHTPGIIFRFLDVVDAIQTPELRRFLSDVYSVPEIYDYYWTCPASQSHHHAYRGGLAEHSVEMAENVRDTPRLSDIERDVGMVHALLHDVGKIWCYDEKWTHLKPIGHELVGLAKLHGQLEELETNWPDGAVALRSLLSGSWKRTSGMPLMSVGSLVRAFDQASAESSMRLHRVEGRRPWTPELPNGGTVLPFKRPSEPASPATFAP